MNNGLKLLIAITLFFITNSTIAQQKANNDVEGLSLNSGSISNQFEYVIKKSSNWRDPRKGQPYKVVKRQWLYELKKHTQDSLNAVHKNLLTTQETIKGQASEISELKSNLSKTKDSLEKTNSEKNNMSLFGLQMSKTSYSTLMWIIIAALLLLLIFFIYKFKNSNTLTKHAKQSLTEIEEEFEEHRKIALEREQKVRRQLQDEINKQKKA